MTEEQRRSAVLMGVCGGLVIFGLVGVETRLISEGIGEFCERVYQQS